MHLLKRIFIVLFIAATLLIAGLVLFFEFYKSSLSANHGKVDAQLFVGESENQPLIVAFGGGQGGNTWTEDYWRDQRNRLLEEGYAVLSIGYFRTQNTPETLDRISLDAIYDTIVSLSRHPKINAEKVALLGSSRGAELALNLASRLSDIDAVVALVPAYVTFPSTTSTGNTSAWTFHREEIPYLEIPLRALIPAWQNNSIGVVNITLEGERARPSAVIPVEQINGPILLLSAEKDQVWPSTYMSDKIVNRLKDNNFKYHYEHFSFDGGHHDTKKHFDRVVEFLNNHFK